MLGRKQSLGSGAGSSIEIDAPISVVWRILTNVEAHETIFSTCFEVKNLNPKKSLNPVEPGAKYLEKRRFRGRNIIFVSYVTVVDEENHVYAEASSFFHCTATMTIRLHEIEGGRCRLSGTYGMVPEGFLGKLYLWRQGKQLEKDGQEEIMADVRDIKQAAESGEYKTEDSEPVTESIASTGDSGHVYYGKAPLQCHGYCTKRKRLEGIRSNIILLMANLMPLAPREREADP